MKIHEATVITYAHVEQLVMEYYEEGIFRIELFASPYQIQAFARYDDGRMFAHTEENSDIYYIEYMFPVKGYAVKVRLMPMEGTLFDNCFGTIGYKKKEE